MQQLVPLGSNPYMLADIMGHQLGTSSCLANYLHLDFRQPRPAHSTLLSAPAPSAPFPSPCILAGFASCVQAANNFAKLLKAYEVLGDEEQRRLYDRGDLVEATLSL